MRLANGRVNAPEGLPMRAAISESRLQPAPTSASRVEACVTHRAQPVPVEAEGVRRPRARPRG